MWFRFIIDSPRTHSHLALSAQAALVQLERFKVSPEVLGSNTNTDLNWQVWVIALPLARYALTDPLPQPRVLRKISFRIAVAVVVFQGITFSRLTVLLSRARQYTHKCRVQYNSYKCRTDVQTPSMMWHARNSARHTQWGKQKMFTGNSLDRVGQFEGTCSSVTHGVGEPRMARELVGRSDPKWPLRLAKRCNCGSLTGSFAGHGRLELGKKPGGLDGRREMAGRPAITGPPPGPHGPGSLRMVGLTGFEPATS
jgi:hypothetical protein